jgi:hypothetical protein
MHPKEFLVNVLAILAKQRVAPTNLLMMSLGKYIHTKKLEICAEYHDHSASGAPVNAATW